MTEREGFKNSKRLQQQKLREMEKMDLSGHQSGMLKLTRRAVIASFDRVFGMKIVDSQGEKQKDKQEGDVVLFPVRLSHRIPRSTNIREIGGECQILSKD